MKTGSVDQIPIGSSKGLKGKGRGREPGGLAQFDQDIQLDWLAELWVTGDARSMLTRAGRIVMDLSQLLERTEREMEQLCAQSRVRTGLGLQLAMQRRRASGAVSLRWRTDRQRTLSADAFAQRVSALPAEAAEWYAYLHAQARWLNSRERLVRHARQVMRDLYAERS